METVFVWKNNRYTNIKVRDIKYVESRGSRIKLATTNEDYYLTKSLRHFVGSMLVPNLIRIHRSFLVNFEHINSFDHFFVYIDGYQLPIGATYRAKFLKSINCGGLLRKKRVRE